MTTLVRSSAISRRSRVNPLSSPRTATHSGWSLTVLDEIDRTEFDTVIDTIQADLDIAREFVDGEAPTDRMAAVRALYRQTLLAWETGIAEFQAAVLGAADDPDNLWQLIEWPKPWQRCGRAMGSTSTW